MTKRMTKRHYPPAKRRYAQRHPTVSFRCRDREEHEYITATADKHGLSIAQYVRQALYSGIEECETAYQKGYRRGYQHGFVSGTYHTFVRFAFYYTCPVCGKTIYAPADTKEYNQASIYLTAKGWRHKDCNAPTQRYTIAGDRFGSAAVITSDGDEFTVEPLND